MEGRAGGVTLLQGESCPGLDARRGVRGTFLVALQSLCEERRQGNIRMGLRPSCAAHKGARGAQGGILGQYMQMLVLKIVRIHSARRGDKENTERACALRSFSTRGGTRALPLSLAAISDWAETAGSGTGRETKREREGGVPMGNNRKP